VPLRVKVDGPAAISIVVLIERGEAAAKRVSEEYADYAKMMVAKIVSAGKALLKGQTDSAEWNSLHVMVRDLRTGGESAKHFGLAEICTSLERVCTRCDRFDPRLPKVIDLHLDALTLGAYDALPEEKFHQLHRELSSAASILSPGEGYVRS
jgi:hypothetical protein